MPLKRDKIPQYYTTMLIHFYLLCNNHKYGWSCLELWVSTYYEIYAVTDLNNVKTSYLETTAGQCMEKPPLQSPSSHVGGDESSLHLKDYSSFDLW